ncbi:LPS export ABC transporter periplasmic protein LptC [Dysgonomonas sp. Marseille-P4677]|uniref:LPS export ABC transporter periplasmic protein LptC n=1 Tax=Dysgonomonas sp. Marseille-P4677 TaxID=2364790 RepID=UPI001912EDDC|nr:LPS export ABC transporter periplasmic protein LptC [Dysgonomonas sp. Marseille-P4677]MBK5722929.1 LPS export ABC transporter periplasmic protein LptC [Dysgonomonas sp. Marseille-P4677]
MKSIQKQSLLVAVVVIFFTTPFFFASCKDETKSSVNFTYDKETVPTMSTDSMNALISDSGVISYRLVAKTCDVFDQAKDPYWLYPQGIYFEKFDSVFNVVFTVKADTAWNFTARKLWKLKGHVFVKNIVGETFTSDELFWNHQQQKIYSDKFVKIDRPDKGILQGKGGFVANQQMTEYEFKDVGESTSGKTIIYVNEEQENSEEKVE